MVDLRGEYGPLTLDYPVRSLGTVTAYIVHHSETEEPSSEAGALQQIENVHQFHRNTRGWPGFAYNSAIWRDTYFRVRPANRMGWHSAGIDQNQNGIGDWNERGFAVVLLGTYTNAQPSDQTLETVLAARTIEEAELFGARPLQLRGHRSGWNTVCPGNWWPSWSAAHGGV